MRPACPRRRRRCVSSRKKAWVWEPVRSWGRRRRGRLTLPLRRRWHGRTPRRKGGEGANDGRALTKKSLALWVGLPKDEMLAQEADSPGGGVALHLRVLGVAVAISKARLSRRRRRGRPAHPFSRSWRQRPARPQRRHGRRRLARLQRRLQHRRLVRLCSGRSSQRIKATA